MKAPLWPLKLVQCHYEHSTIAARLEILSSHSVCTQVRDKSVINLSSQTLGQKGCRALPLSYKQGAEIFDEDNNRVAISQVKNELYLLYEQSKNLGRNRGNKICYIAVLCSVF